MSPPVMQATGCLTTAAARASIVCRGGSSAARDCSGGSRATRSAKLWQGCRASGQGCSIAVAPQPIPLHDPVTFWSTALLLDEFQTWYDGLTNTQQYPWRNWAFNFIQILSEIANDHPDLLVFVVSIRDNQSQAYQQVHRINPVLVDFQGTQARKDRHHVHPGRCHQDTDRRCLGRPRVSWVREAV